MREHELYQGILDGGREEKWVLFRVHDSTFGRNPFDISGCDPLGRGVGLEVKRARDGVKFDRPMPWDRFEVHQIGWLKAFAEQRALALVALHDDVQKKLYLAYFPTVGSFMLPAGEVIVGALEPVREEFRGWTALLDAIEARRPAARRRPKAKKTPAVAAPARQ